MPCDRVQTSTSSIPMPNHSLNQQQQVSTFGDRFSRSTSSLPQSHAQPRPPLYPTVNPGSTPFGRDQRAVSVGGRLEGNSLNNPSNRSTLASTATAIPAVVQRAPTAEEEMARAIQASAYEAELEGARRRSEADEENRMMELAIAESARMLTMRRATEREEVELELVLALSLSDDVVEARRDGQVVTSSQEFRRLSRPSASAIQQVGPEDNDRLSVAAALPLPITPPSRSFIITNPDEDDAEDSGPPPPAYDLLPPPSDTTDVQPDTAVPISSPSIPHVLHSVPPIVVHSTIPTLQPPIHPSAALDSSASSPIPASVLASSPTWPDDHASTPVSVDAELGKSEVSIVEEEDPFDERFAAVVSEDQYDYGQEGERTGGSPSLLSNPTSAQQSPSMGYRRSSRSSIPESSPTSTRRMSSYSSTSSLYGSDLEQTYIVPDEGGVVDSTRSNVLASEEVLHEIQFGFVPYSSAVRALHPPLKMRGMFPDIVLMSRGTIGGGQPPFRCFAVEAKGWKSLLQFLMWHGNSRIEVAARDLRVDPERKGFSCSIMLEFFRSFENGKTKVRCRLDLHPTESSAAVEDNFATPLVLDSDCPNISIRLPTHFVLPMTLSSLAKALSLAHTGSRQQKRSNLPLAIDLLKTLNGEEVLSAADVESDEGKLLSKLKSRLKRRKRAPGIVKGGEDGTGNRSEIWTGELPEGATMVTPFRLDD